MRRALLCILDGWGLGTSGDHNALSLAHTPAIDSLLAENPYALLSTSGADVGLPDGQMGNSEVGHMTIGSGRVVLQDLLRINQAISSDTLAKNEALQDIISECSNTKNNSLSQAAPKRCHVIGLLSDGGVHSHIDHILAVLEILAQFKVTAVLHAITDGRDTLQAVSQRYFERFEELLSKYPQYLSLGSISGRYYAMDRGGKMDRTQKAYEVIARGTCNERFTHPLTAISAQYQKGMTDEFLEPMIHVDYRGMVAGDAVLFMNFRSDRMRQLAELFVAERNHYGKLASLAWYSDRLSQDIAILFPPITVSNTLGEIIAKHGLTQLRLAEAEKYPHVTFFFNGASDVIYQGEERVIVASPAVETYNKAPEMSADAVTQKLVKAITEGKHSLMVVNYANMDMVGHTGDMKAAIKACEKMDAVVSIIQAASKQYAVDLVITSDHGNIEYMRDPASHKPYTAHTTNPVAFVYCGDGFHINRKRGTLADIAPTILDIMGLETPQEMVGRSLVVPADAPATGKKQ